MAKIFTAEEKEFITRLFRDEKKTVPEIVIILTK